MRILLRGIFLENTYVSRQRVVSHPSICQTISQIEIPSEKAREKCFLNKYKRRTHIPNF